MACIQYPTRVAGTGTGLLFAGGYGFIKPMPAGFVPVAIPICYCKGILVANFNVAMSL
jgi:hypothetical protein